MLSDGLCAGIRFLNTDNHNTLPQVASGLKLLSLSESAANKID